jgi:hypothetical protein
VSRARRPATPDEDVELEALRRWQQHKDDEHPRFSADLRRQDPVMEPILAPRPDQ